MAETTTPEATLATYDTGWHAYQTSVITALAPVSAEQLTLRAAPHLRSVGEIATHVIGARARWFLGLGEGDEAVGALATWDRPGMPARSAAELVDALDTTWRVMQEAVARWTPVE